MIKGVASALYGAGALGGVVDLISRRPTNEPSREALVNRTTRGGTDATLNGGSIVFASPSTPRTWAESFRRGSIRSCVRFRRPTVGGRVDAWAPLDGRVVNGGIRLAF